MFHLQKSTLNSLAAFLALLIAIPACSSLAPPGPSLLSPAEMQTAIAGTAQALQTNTLPSNVRSGLGPDETTPSPTDTQALTDTAEPTATFEPTPTETVQASSLPPYIPDPSQYEIGLVTHVVNGDTIDAVINGQEHRIGYIGMIALIRRQDSDRSARRQKLQTRSWSKARSSRFTKMSRIRTLTAGNCASFSSKTCS